MTIDAYCTIGTDREYDLAPETLLAALDRAEVERAIIAPVDRCLAVRNREGNDSMLDAARKHPRLIPACSVNPWFGEDALTELDRSLAEGSRLLVLYPFVQGFQCNDELAWPVLEHAIAARVPIYIHTGTPGSSTPWQVVDIAIRYPEGMFIIGHSGATDFWNDVVSAASAASNVMIESSCARPFNFVRYLSELSPVKGIMGSFAPNNELSFEWEQMRSVLPPKSHEAVLGGNLQTLLERRGAL
jgi:uncharacterized protein